MTLVEVVGGLGLLATLLVALLMAKARYTRQSAVADRRLRAVAAAESLLVGWRQDARSLPRNGGGGVAGEEGLVWRTRVVPNAEVNEMGAAVVRLEILDERRVDESDRSAVVTAVEFVVEKEEAVAPALVTGVVDKTSKKQSAANGKVAKPLRNTLQGQKKNATKGLHNP